MKLGGQVLLVVHVLVALCQASAQTDSLRAIWLGQDGHDYCQTARALGPNDIQDLHVRLEGLDPEAEIEGILVRRSGGGEWAALSAGGPWTWKARLRRAAGATSADLYMEPSHDDTRFVADIDLRYSNGASNTVRLSCGRSDPNRFMPSATVQARWAGHEGVDWTGAGPAVGPDGWEDVGIELSGISTNLSLQAIAVRSDSQAWEYGLNPLRLWNAELLREEKNKTRGTLYFSPDRNLEGESLRITVVYENSRSNSTSVVAKESDARTPMRAPALPSVRTLPIKTEWLGQDATGNIRIRVRGIPDTLVIQAAALSDAAGGYWIYRGNVEHPIHPPAGFDSVPALPMNLQRGIGVVDLVFPPYRNEADTPMLLRLVMDDGTIVVHRFIGTACDPSRRGELPSANRVSAKPGDDLNELANRYGRIELSADTYQLDRPLTLRKPVSIVGSRRAVVYFRQDSSNAVPWRGAILIGAGNTTLEGFSVRFSPNFRWDVRGPEGAAILRTFPASGRRETKANITVRGLDVESSTAATPNDPKRTPEAPYLVRFTEATSGRLVENRFKGGTVDLNNGPWEIRGNEHRGTQPGTFAWDAFGGHWLHDFVLENNRVFADAPSGKIWRFISMNQIGQRVTIRSNDVSSVGMRDDDTIPNPNAPEILLTESYRLNFEGKPSAVSRDGQILQIPMVMYGAVRAGSVVSILSGEHAGQFRTVAQPLEQTVFLMQEPMPPGDYAISIAHGYVNPVIEGNRIDVRGGKSAVIVLAGNHWGAIVRGNRLLGGGDSMLIQSTPTENPFIWGWSHTPFFGFVCEGNIHEETRNGVSLDIHSNRHNKTTRGRTYMSGVFRNNVARWPRGRPNGEAFRLGPHSDPNGGTFNVTMSGNRIERGTAP